MFGCFDCCWIWFVGLSLFGYFVPSRLLILVVNCVFLGLVYCWKLVWVSLLGGVCGSCLVFAVISGCFSVFVFRQMFGGGVGDMFAL